MLLYYFHLILPSVFFFFISSRVIRQIGLVGYFQVYFFRRFLLVCFILPSTAVTSVSRSQSVPLFLLIFFNASAFFLLFFQRGTWGVTVYYWVETDIHRVQFCFSYYPHLSIGCLFILRMLICSSVFFFFTFSQEFFFLFV